MDGLAPPRPLEAADFDAARAVADGWFGHPVGLTLHRLFFDQLGPHGVWTTAVGYAGGFTRNPLYEEVCTGRTGHTEVVLAVFDPSVTSYGEMLRTFWEGHDPTQGFRQGNDVGTQYRSAIYFMDDRQQQIAEASREMFQGALDAAGAARITTEIAAAGPFYYAEGYHQQYLAKNPNGYCGLGGTGVTCPVGIAEMA